MGTPQTAAARGTVVSGGVARAGASPRLNLRANSKDKTLWALACAGLVIPLTAIFHNAIFYRSMCMLNGFGPDYTPGVVVNWLTHDPSLLFAIALAMIVYVAGSKLKAARVVVNTAFWAWLPLSIWVWDIPFLGRPICHAFHDGRGLFWLRARVLYLLCLLLHVCFILLQRMRPKHAASAAT